MGLSIVYVKRRGGVGRGFLEETNTDAVTGSGTKTGYDRFEAIILRYVLH